MQNDNKEIFEDEEEEYDGSKLEKVNNIKTTPNINSLIGQWESKNLLIPNFQRKFVWSIEQSSKFIESLMLGLPIPSLMFYQDKNGVQQIVDGQQRIKSILFFVGNVGDQKLSKEEENRIKFKLTGLSDDSEFYNKDFEHFSPKQKNDFLYMISLDVNIITLPNPDDLTSVYYIFERLNTGGTPLKPQEIRNCICTGKFNKFLLSLNEYPTWRNFFNESKAIDHLQDVELILRFFALYDRLELYKSPMKDYLTDYMKEMKNISNEEIEKKEGLFKSTIESVHLYLGRRAFRPNSGINSAVYDSIMLAFAKNLNNVPKDIKDKYDKLCTNQEYLKYCGKSSGDNSSVRNRIQMANDFLFDKVKDINSKIIKLYDLPVSAGTGNWLGDEELSYEEIVTTNRKADFAVKISGDSMIPNFNDGDIVLVKIQKDVPHGKIGIFTYKNKAYCKKIVKSKKVVYLQSFNSKKYPIMKIEDKDQFYVNGIVLDVISN